MWLNKSRLLVRACSGQFPIWKHLRSVTLSRPLSSCHRLSQKAHLPKLTCERHPHMKRGNYSELTEDDIQMFRNLIPGEGRVLTEDLEGYNTDWLKTVRGSGQIVLKPKTTAEVSQIIKYCSSRNLAVVPQGGNTGLVGGSVPVFDEVILSTQLMNKIISLDETGGILVCQSGCVLETLDNYLADYSLMMPLDLGAKGSCQIGGNVSTNAGGIRLLRYGSLHGSVLGIEAVAADGEVIDCLSSLRKDNTGYDLKQLFIGSEGTLGIVTGVSILCPQRPNSVNVAFLGCSDFGQVLQVLKSAKGQLGEILSAFELIDEECSKCMSENLQVTTPLSPYPFYVLIETSGSKDEHDEEKLHNFLEGAMEQGIVEDGTVVTEGTKIKHLWGLRERIAEGLLHDGYCYKYDVSLPLAHYYKFVEIMRERLGDKVVRVVGYGHVGDGNLHFNVTTEDYNAEVHALVEPFVYEYIGKVMGSISAEHGLGLAKNQYIHHSKSPEAISLMKKLKTVMDPKGILNPYKTLPS